MYMNLKSSPLNLSTAVMRIYGERQQVQHSPVLIGIYPDGYDGLEEKHALVQTKGGSG